MNDPATISTTIPAALLTAVAILLWWLWMESRRP